MIKKYNPVAFFEMCGPHCTHLQNQQSSILELISRFFSGKFLAVALFIFCFKVWPENMVQLHKCRPHATHTPQGGNPIRKYSRQEGGIEL